MDPVIKVLEERGLACLPQAEDSIRVLSPREITSVCEEIEEALIKTGEFVASGTNEDWYNFLGSSSIRGDTGCVECATTKLENLARYAALYADRLILPVGLHIRCPKSESDHVRYSLLRRIEKFVYLRPLIDAGIVYLVPDHNCAEHFPEHGEKSSQLNNFADELSRHFCKQFHLTVYPGKSCSHHTAVHLEGPEEFLEHGELWIRIDGRPAWIPSVNPSSEPYELPHDAIHRSGDVSRIFRAMANDLFAHQVYGRKYNASYLTDLTGEAIFATAVGNAEVAAEKAKFTELLTHSVPLLNNVPIETVVRLRRENPEAFVRYRNALNKILQDHLRRDSAITEADARALFRDELQPSLDDLSFRAQHQWRLNIKKASRRTLALTATVAVGIMAGLLPHAAADVLRLLGITAASGIVEQGIEALSTDDGVKQHDLYYLLRMKDESEA